MMFFSPLIESSIINQSLPNYQCNKELLLVELRKYFLYDFVGLSAFNMQTHYKGEELDFMIHL